jgi:hypothetical protein
MKRGFSRIGKCLLVDLFGLHLMWEQDEHQYIGIARYDDGGIAIRLWAI